MLSFFNSFVVPGVDATIYHDDQDDHLFFMLPNAPSLVKADDGGPMFNMIVFARDFHLMKDAATQLESTETEGALISMASELRVSDADQEKIRSYIQNTFFQAPTFLRPRYIGPREIRFEFFQVSHDPVRLAYPTWVDDANAKVTFNLVPAGGTTFVKATDGSDKPSLLGTNKANYSALLGQEGEILFRDLVDNAKGGYSPGSVNYGLSFVARIPSVTIDVTGTVSSSYQELKNHCTVNEVYQNGSSVSSYTYPAVSSLEELKNTYAGLTINVDNGDFRSATGSQDPSVAQQVEKTLNDMALNIIQDYLKNVFFAPTFSKGLEADKLGTSAFQNDPNRPAGTPPPPGNQLWLKDFSQISTGTLDFHIKYTSNITVTVYPNCLLFELLTRDEVHSRIITADLSHPYFQILDVTVMVTANFESDPIEAVKVFLDYNQKDETTGEQKAYSKEYLFTTGQESYHFQTVMAKAQDGTPKDSYTYHSEIIYKSTAQSDHSQSVVTRDRVLIIGYNQLNCVRVQATWGAVPTDTVQRLQVHFKYPGIDLPTAQKDLFLSPDHISDSWFTYTGGSASSDYQYAVSYFLNDGQRIDLPAQTSSSNSIVLNAPFQDTLRATFIPQGSFPPTSSIVVSTRYQDEKNNYSKEDVHTFSSLTSTWTWEVRLEDRTLRTFQYKVDVTYADGSADQGQWQGGTEGTILVGQVARQILEIDVVPSLLDMQKVWKLVIVRLKYADPDNQISQDQIFQITAANANQTLSWKVPLKNPLLNSFSYEIDGFGYDNSKKIVGPTQTQDRVLVLQL